MQKKYWKQNCHLNNVLEFKKFDCWQLWLHTPIKCGLMFCWYKSDVIIFCIVLDGISKPAQTVNLAVVQIRNNKGGFEVKYGGIHTHTHTHTHIYIYICLLVHRCMSLYKVVASKSGFPVNIIPQPTSGRPSFCLLREIYYTEIIYIYIYIYWIHIQDKRVSMFNNIRWYPTK